jgi:hypothetical protein
MANDFLLNHDLMTSELSLNNNKQNLVSLNRILTRKSYFCSVTILSNYIMSELILGVGSRVKHPQFGKGVIVQIRSDAYEIGFIEHGVRQILPDYEGMEVIEAVETPSDLATYEKIEKSLVRVLRRFSDVQETVPLGQKWTGGRMVLYPGDKSLKEKEVPIETFFHKIVMVRDRVRVMEQRINSSNLTDEEKVDLEQYITRIYGSLTTFNVLFKNKEDQFTGDKGNKD